MRDGEATNENQRRQLGRVIVATTLALLPLGVRLATVMSSETVTEHRSMCRSTWDLSALDTSTLSGLDETAIDLDEPFTIELPCDPVRVERTASWRWPAAGVISAAIVLGGALTYVHLSRRLGREASMAPGPLPPVRGRFVLRPIANAGLGLLSAAMFAIAVVAGITGGGALITALTAAGGLIILPEALSGTVIIRPDQLVVRSKYRTHRWLWDEVEAAAVVDASFGVRAFASRQLSITAAGRTLSNPALAVLATGSTRTRADRVAATINARAAACRSGPTDQHVMGTSAI